MTELGERLGAAYVLSGALREERDGLSLVMELTRARSSSVAWTARYHVDRIDLADVQIEIVNAVGHAVGGTVSVAGRRLTSDRARDGIAYAHVVRASAFVSRRVLLPALVELQAAVTRDSGSALAWARLSQVYSLCVNSAPCEQLHDSTYSRLARSAVDRALRLDSTISDVWLAEGLQRINTANWDLPAARNALTRAVRLDPQNAEAQHVLGFTLLRLAEDSASITAYRRALAIDPGRAVSWEHLGRVALTLGRYEDMEAFADTALLLQANFAGARNRKWQSILLREQVDRIRKVAPAYRISETGRVSYATWEAAYVARLIGDTVAARLRLNELASREPGNVFVALLLFRDGQVDAARRIIQAAADQNIAPATWYTLRLAAYEPLKTLPEFNALLDRLKKRTLWTAGGSPPSTP